MPNKSLEKGQIMLAPYGSSTTKKTKVRIIESQASYAKVEYVEKKVREELGNKPFLIQTKNLKPIATAKMVQNGNKIVPRAWVAQNMKQFPEFINSVFLPYRVKETVNKKNNKFEYTTYQKFVRDYLSMSSPYRGILLYHGLGSGKCMAKGTKLLMFDGSIKKIEDIKIGDKLMGDDSKARNVLSLARGKDKMYNIIPSKKNFTKYTVNSEHILCLKFKPYIKNEKAHWIENNEVVSCSVATLKDVGCSENLLKVKESLPNVLEIEVEDFLKRNDQNDFYGFKLNGETTPIKIEFDKIDEYYGFELDGNGRYLLADFTVTHNTCSSIAVAENLKSGKNVVVLSPASLRSNYIYALMNDCGVTSYKNNQQLLNEKYTFVSYNASNTIDQLKKISTLDDHTIIIDEVHNLISMMVSKSKKGPEIYKMLMEAKNLKIVALSGTPIINYPFEVALLCNLLRGYISIPVFFIQSVKEAGGLEWQMNILKEKIGELANVDYVDTQQRYVYAYLNIKPYEDKFDEVIREILKIANKFGVRLDYMETRKFSLYPEDEDEFRRYFIEETQDGELLKNLDLLKRRMLGLISYYRGGKPIYYPTVNPTHFEIIPMSDYQYQVYKEVRDVERDKEKAGAMQKLLGMVTNSKSKNGAMKKVSSLFRVFSREFSNFVFPPDIERPFVRKFLHTAKKKKLEKKAKKSNTAAANLEELEKENKRMMENNTISKKDKQLIEEAIEKLSKKKDEYLKNTEDGLKRFSPKMSRIIEIMDKSPGLILVYSAFRSLEGIGVLSLALEANGWKRYKIDANNNGRCFATYSGEEDEQTREKLRKIFNSPENKYGEHLKALLVTSAGAEGIDLKNIRQVHIMEPYWHDIRVSQVIGRANRLLSHVDLPEKDRVVDVYRYMSVLTEDQKEVDADKESTDEYIYEIAKKKLRVTDEIKRTMKDIAVDCVLNSVDNEKEIKCFNFGTDATGLAYKADLKEDMVYGKTELATKIVKKKLEPMFMDEENRLIWADKKKKLLCYFNNKECKEPLKTPPKNVKKVAVDLNTNEVFDIGSAKFGNPIRLGIIDERGIMV